MSEPLATSYSVCHEIVRQRAPAIAWCLGRVSNDHEDHVAAILALSLGLRGIVAEFDAGRLSREDARGGLEFWRQWIEDGCWDEVDDPVAPAVRYAVLANEIPTELLVQHVTTLENDLERSIYPEFSDVAGYCYGVASTVCLAVCHVCEVEGDEALARAAEMGVALQLTTIIRDVGVNLAAGRIYLPRAAMERHRVTEAHLRANVITRGYAKLIAELSRVANAYYDSAMAGLKALPAGERRAVAAAAAVHREALREVRRNRYDNLTKRATVAAPRKLALATRSVLHPRPATGAVPEGLPDGVTLIGSG